jgi:arylsulfatase A-like enzyme
MTLVGRTSVSTTEVSRPAERLILDRLASEGVRFTDYYAEASCTSGRANFITGELQIRTGLTTVGQAGVTIGIPAQAHKRQLSR